MSTATIPWLPAGGIWLETANAPDVRPSRPWSQGDVFVDVTIYLADGKVDDPNAKRVRGHAMLIGHTCSMRGGARLAVIQNVCAVRAAKEKEALKLVEAENTFRQLFPLPGLVSDELWVADFNVLGSVKFTHLNSKRVACLNHAGWAALQIRYAHHSTRIDQPLEKRIDDIRPTWIEVELWEEWCVRGHPELEYQPWLNELAGVDDTAGLTRRKALEFLPDVVRAQIPPPPTPAEAPTS